MSSTEAEYVALCDACKEAVWLIRLINEIMGWSLNHVITHVDNKSAIALAKNSMVKQRSKHIDLRYHWIREKVKEGLFTLVHISTHDNLADLLTKILGLPKQHKLLQGVMKFLL